MIDRAEGVEKGALRHFDKAVASVMAQTDPNWMINYFVKGEKQI